MQQAAEAGDGDAEPTPSFYSSYSDSDAAAAWEDKKSEEEDPVRDVAFQLLDSLDMFTEVPHCNTFIFCPTAASRRLH